MCVQYSEWNSRIPLSLLGMKNYFGNPQASSYAHCVHRPILGNGRHRLLRREEPAPASRSTEPTVSSRSANISTADAAGKRQRSPRAVGGSQVGARDDTLRGGRLSPPPSGAPTAAITPCVPVRAARRPPVTRSRHTCVVTGARRNGPKFAERT